MKPLARTTADGLKTQLFLIIRMQSAEEARTTADGLKTIKQFHRMTHIACPEQICNFSIETFS
jgi:hypothetical protein